MFLLHLYLSIAIINPNANKQQKTQTHNSLDFLVRTYSLFILFPISFLSGIQIAAGKKNTLKSYFDLNQHHFQGLSINM